MRNQYAVILAIIVVIIVAIFAVINVDPVEVNYVFGSGQAPLVLVILISVLLGGILTGAAGAVKIFRLQRENRYLKSQLKQQEDDKQPSETKNSHNETETPHRQSGSNHRE